MSDRWRGVLAALLNPDLRLVLAGVIIESEGGRTLTPARRARALARLRESGLVRVDAAGPSFDEAAVGDILRETSTAQATGPSRFLDAYGRVDRYPVRAGDRRELLAWIAERAYRPGEVLTEPEVTQRLAVFADDPVVLRRYLVDHGMLERTRSGSEYASVAPEG